jgi:hypothetical protein
MARNPEVLVSTQAQDQLKNLFSQAGPQGATLYQQTLEILRQALNAGLAEVFLIALIVTAVAFVISFFVKELPLRKQHVLSDESGTSEKSVDE